MQVHQSGLDDTGAVSDAAVAAADFDLAAVLALVEACLGTDLPTKIHPFAALRIERYVSAGFIEVDSALYWRLTGIIEGEKSCRYRKRGAPHSGFSRLMRRIKSRSSAPADAEPEFQPAVSPESAAEIGR
jgi:hypothetical protein